LKHLASRQAKGPWNFANTTEKTADDENDDEEEDWGRGSPVKTRANAQD
jgi:hypothetical protein